MNRTFISNHHKYIQESDFNKHRFLETLIQFCFILTDAWLLDMEVQILVGKLRQVY